MTSKDDINPIKRTILPQGRTQNTNKFKRENPEHLYATKYQKVQQELGANQPESEPVIIGDVDYATQRIFNKYRFKITPRNDLPIFQARTQILEEIRDNPVVIVTGHTGSGILKTNILMVKCTISMF